MFRGDDTPEVSVVGPGTRIEGTVVAAGSLRVEGEVKGKITAEREVTLSPQGRVEANIQAGSIVLAGQVRGNLAAKGDVSLPADSRLDGNIRGHNVDVGGVVMGDIVGKGKPHPETVDRLVTQFGAARERTLMVGDTTFDIEMGQAAGVSTCAVTYGMQPEATLRRLQPSFVIDRIEELNVIVRGA